MSIYKKDDHLAIKINIDEEPDMSLMGADFTVTLDICHQSAVEAGLPAGWDLDREFNGGTSIVKSDIENALEDGTSEVMEELADCSWHEHVGNKAFEYAVEHKIPVLLLTNRDKKVIEIPHGDIEAAFASYRTGFAAQPC